MIRDFHTREFIKQYICMLQMLVENHVHGQGHQCCKFQGCGFPRINVRPESPERDCHVSRNNVT